MKLKILAKHNAGINQAALICVLILALPLESLALSDLLRPAALINTVSVQDESLGKAHHIDGALETGERGFGAFMVRYHGVASSLPGTATGRAGIISAYSGYDMLTSLSPEEVELETKEKLPRLIETLKQTVRGRTDIDVVAAIVLLNECCTKIESYFTGHAGIELAEGRLIRNSIGAIEFFLSMNLRKAFVANDVNRVALIRGLLGTAQEIARTTIDQETFMSAEEAKAKWKVFDVACKKLIKDNDARQKECNEQRKVLGGKIRALTDWNNTLKQILKDADHVEEAEAIEATIKDNESLITQCAQAQAHLEKEWKVCDVNKTVIRAIASDTIKGPSNLIAKRRTLLQILYLDAYAVFEENALNTDRFNKQGRLAHKVQAEVMRRVESIIAQMTGAPVAYLKTDETTEGCVVFANHEIPIEALPELAKEYDIRAIVCLEGTIVSHWVSVAQSMGILVVLLESVDMNAGEIVSLGEVVIVEKRMDKEKGTVIVRPNQKTRHKYGISSLRQELYYDLCLQQYALNQAAGVPSRLGIYANVASAKDIKEAREIGAQGIGLYRTEFSPGEETKEAIKAFLEEQSLVNTRRLLEAFTDDLYLSFGEFAEQAGPLTIRTDDFEDDKNTAHIIEVLGATGFDIYETPIGKKLVELRIASVFVALDKLQKGGGYSFTPKIIFPMIKEERNVHFMRKQVMPQAEALARGFLEISELESLPDVTVSPMIETVESMYQSPTDMGVNRAGFDIIDDSQTDLVPVGNSDLTQSHFSELLGVDVSRDDKHFRLFFSTLKPSICERYIALAKAVSVWNSHNTDNIKTLGFCGAIATIEEFILLACFLQAEYKNVPMYISVPPKFIPLLDQFMRNITEEDLSIFRAGIGFKTQNMAHAKVQEIHERIRNTAHYTAMVEGRLRRIQELGVEAVPSSQKNAQAVTMQRALTTVTAIDSAV